MKLGSEIVCSIVSTINLLLNPGIPLKGACFDKDSTWGLFVAMPVDVSVGCKASPAGLFIPLKVNGLPVKSGYRESYNVVFY